MMKLSESLKPVGCGRDLITFVAKQFSQRRSRVGFVIDNQNKGLLYAIFAPNNIGNFGRFDANFAQPSSN